MGKYAILMDETRCTGCRACQVACKQWNDLEAEITTNRGSYTNPPALSDKTWLRLVINETERAAEPEFHYFRNACMHCEHPSCASVCPVAALHKSPDGPVVYDDTKCIGCRYCMNACPYGIPTFEWDKGLAEKALIRKCNLCVDRITNGLLPACVNTCPTGALTFGERTALLAEARTRINKTPDRYVDHVFGESEGGGTSVLYLSAVPFAQLGLPELGPEPITALSEAVMDKTIPFAVVWGAALAGTAAFFRRRSRGLHAEAVKEETS